MFNPIVDPEFRDLLRKHTADELSGLEASVLADPKHETMPRIIVWPTPEGDVIVDGNNQYALRQQNGLAIEYVAKSFPDRAAAKDFATAVQLSRRNLTPSQRALIVASLPRLSVGKPPVNSANLPNFNADDLAKRAGVSQRTMTSAHKVADNAAPAVFNGVRDGDFKVSDAAAVANLPKPIQERLAAKAKLGGTTLRKAAEPSGGTSFDPEELEIAIAVGAAKPTKNGVSVVDGKRCVQAKSNIGRVARDLWALGLYDKHNAALSEMLDDVVALQKLPPPRYAT